MISRRLNAWLAARLTPIGLQKLSAQPPSGWITGIHPVSTGTIFQRLRLPSEGAGTFDLTDTLLQQLNQEIFLQS